MSGQSEHIKCILLGSGLIFTGCFLPLVSVPVLGSLSYLDTGRWDAFLVLALAIVAAILGLKERFAPCFAIGGLCSGTQLYSLGAFWWNLREFRAEVKEGTSDSLFSGLADIAANSIRLQWAWPVLFIGSLLVMAGGWQAVTSERGAPPFALPSNLLKYIGVLTVCAIAFYFILAGLEILPPSMLPGATASPSPS